MDEGDLLLCEVERITQTTVFVKMPDGKEGTIVISEVAPGRIKNLRQYVVPKKKIVCKVLRVRNNHVELSLRRVSSKERKQVMQKFKQEKTINSAFKQVVEDFEVVSAKILKDFESLYDFAVAAREDKELIEKYVPEKSQEKIEKIVSKKQKQMQVVKKINLKCPVSDGVLQIMKIFSGFSDAKVTYISAGKFQISLKSDDYKTANKRMDEILGKVEGRAKKFNCDFLVEEK